MAQPEKYVCQVFRSAPSTSWTYVPPGSVMPSEVSPSPVEPQAKPEERKSEAVPPKPDASADPTPKEIAKPKRVAQQPRHDQQAMVEGRQTMFEGNPLTGFFSW